MYFAISVYIDQVIVSFSFFLGKTKSFKKDIVTKSTYLFSISYMDNVSVMEEYFLLFFVLCGKEKKRKIHFCISPQTTSQRSQNILLNITFLICEIELYHIITAESIFKGIIDNF